MGSLTSRPKAPAQPQIVYIPAPAISTAPQVSSSATEAVNPEPTPEQTATEARAKSLLQRSRGRFGTIQTSFRGLLGLAEPQDKRKTLLGE